MSYYYRRNPTGHVSYRHNNNSYSPEEANPSDKNKNREQKKKKDAYYDKIEVYVAPFGLKRVPNDGRE